MQRLGYSPVLDLTTGHGNSVITRACLDVVGYSGFSYALTLIPISLVTILD
jgi:hypothetical protein